MAKGKRYSSSTRRSTRRRKGRRTKTRSRTRSRSARMIESPESGRWIRIGGPAYKDLLRLGYTDAQLRRRKTRVRKRPSRRYSRSAGVKSLGPRRKMRVSRASLSSTRGKGRGSRTRGWGKAAPKRGKPRDALMHKCGPKCFLMPEKKGFPICAKLTGRKSRGSCQIDCRSVQAAYIRAKQWGYEDVARVAKRLLREKCGGR